MKKLIISIVIVIYSIHTQAQGITATPLYCDSLTFIRDILVNADATYYIVGSKYTVSNSIETADGYIAKYTPNHQLLWQKKIGGSSGDQFSQLRKLGTDRLAILGETKSNDGDVSNGYAFTELCPWVLILDTLGAILHSNVWGYGSSTWVCGFDISADGNRLIVSGGTNAQSGAFR